MCTFRCIFLLTGLSVLTLHVAAAPAYGQRYEVTQGHRQWAAMERNTSRPAVTGARVPCTDGTAAGYPCNNVTLLSFLPIKRIGGGNARLNDIWGWTDPKSGKEYALVGRTDGTAFVDISDPTNPVYVGLLPLTDFPITEDDSVHASTWRDIKTYEGYAFVVADGAGEHGMQVFDLTKLRRYAGTPITFTADTVYHKIHSAHNIAINTETGYAYTVGNGGGGITCGGGLHMINIQDPLHPTFAGCFADESTGRRGTGYTHDAQCVIYHGNDEDYQGREICFGLNETALSIADVTDKENPVAIAAVPYPGVSYTHQGWLTENHNYFFSNDELDEFQNRTDETRTLIWDVSNLDDPQFVKSYTFGTTTIDHNLYIKGDRMYQTNYASGLRIHDISNPKRPLQIGFFDTTPARDPVAFVGTWSNYPFFESGVVAVSSIGRGLFVLRPQPPAPNEVVGFRAKAEARSVVLTWATLSEQGNGRFEVQRALVSSSGSVLQWRTVADVPSEGSADAPQRYSYRAENLFPGRYAFRIKQAGAGGQPSFSPERTVRITVDGAYALSGVYPNPFRRSASLKLTVKEPQPVRVAVYDVLGRRVALLHDGPVPAGVQYRFTLDAARLASGVYLWRIVGETFAETRTSVRVR